MNRLLAVLMVLVVILMLHDLNTGYADTHANVCYSMLQYQINILVLYMYSSEIIAHAFGPLMYNNLLYSGVNKKTFQKATQIVTPLLRLSA